MDAEELIRAARDLTGLEEFDDRSFREPLELIAAEIEARPERVEQAMRAWMDRGNRRQAARPGYALEDFGWTERGVAPFFAEYLETYPRAAEA